MHHLHNSVELLKECGAPNVIVNYSGSSRCRRSQTLVVRRAFPSFFLIPPPCPAQLTLHANAARWSVAIVAVMPCQHYSHGMLPAIHGISSRAWAVGAATRLGAHAVLSCMLLWQAHNGTAHARMPCASYPFPLTCWCLVPSQGCPHARRAAAIKNHYDVLLLALWGRRQGCSLQVLLGC